MQYRLQGFYIALQCTVLIIDGTLSSEKIRTNNKKIKYINSHFQSITTNSPGPIS